MGPDVGRVYEGVDFNQLKTTLSCSGPVSVKLRFHINTSRHLPAIFLNGGQICCSTLLQVGIQGMFNF